MFIEAETGYMVRYTIENNKYEGERISYSSCESPKLTSTTLNTSVITWDRLLTKTRHTTTLDTIPGTESTMTVDITQTYKCEIYTDTTMTRVDKDEYMSFYVIRSTGSYTPPDYNAEDGYKNVAYTDKYTALVADDIPNGKASITVQNAYKNQKTETASKSIVINTTIAKYYYNVDVSISTVIIPSGNSFTTMGIPQFITRGYTLPVATTLSKSMSTYSKEKDPLHILGTATLTIPLRTSTAGNTGSMKYTTIGGIPKMELLIGNEVVNSGYITNNRYNVQESFVFYLGTLNVDVETTITKEREVE